MLRLDTHSSDRRSEFLELGPVQKEAEAESELKALEIPS